MYIFNISFKGQAGLLSNFILPISHRTHYTSWGTYSDRVWVEGIVQHNVNITDKIVPVQAIFEPMVEGYI